MSFIGGTPLYAAGQGGTNQTQLQSTLSAATSGPQLPDGIGHHPITCTGELFFDGDGVFGCEHYEMPADDPRTHACLNHSLALLIIELAMKL